jgi:hypothetical protein
MRLRMRFKNEERKSCQRLIAMGIQACWALLAVWLALGPAARAKEGGVAHPVALAWGGVGHAELAAAFAALPEAQRGGMTAEWLWAAMEEVCGV